jgi:putative transposase
MSRGARCAPGGFVYHVLNRAVARLPLFEKPSDYEAFLRVLGEARAQILMRMLAFVLMPNHWHLLLWPEGDHDLSDFCRWLTHTHSMRWHAHYHTSGTGHLYQGRFKAFSVEGNAHFYQVARYIERNPLRANLVSRAEQWRWSSLYGDTEPAPLLAGWPVALPADWVEQVNTPHTEAEMEALRRSVRRGCPFGSVPWQQQGGAARTQPHVVPAGPPPQCCHSGFGLRMNRGCVLFSCLFLSFSEVHATGTGTFYIPTSAIAPGATTITSVSDGTLTNNTDVQGPIGDRIRTKFNCSMGTGTTSVWAYQA